MPNRYGSHHIQRILVMHGVASGTDGPQSSVSIVRQSLHHGAAAVFAMFDRSGEGVGHGGCGYEGDAFNVMGRV